MPTNSHRRSRVWLRLAVVVVLVAGGLLPSAPAFAGASCQPSCHPPLNYYGGYVQEHPKIYLIFWGPKWNSDSNHVAMKNILMNMFKNLAGTAYNNILVQYTQSSISTDPNGYIHNDVAYVDSYVDTSDPNACCNVGLGNADDEVQLAAFTAKPAWKTAWQNDNNDPNFMIFPQQNTSYDGITFGSGICGIHNNDSLYPAGNNLNYSIVKYGDDPQCSGSGSSFDTIRSQMTRTATHEYAETATDPEGIGLLPGGNSWHTSDPQPNVLTAPPEIGDLCGPSVGFMQNPLIGEDTTYLWSNAAGGIGDCVGWMGEDNSTIKVCASGMAAHTVYGDYQDVYDLPAAGSEPSMQSKLGCPTSEKLPFHGGYKQTFSNGGAIYEGPTTQVHELHGAIYALYKAKYEPGISNTLGFPTSDEQNAPGGGRENTFAGSSCGSGSVILWTSGTGAHEMHGCIYDAYLKRFGGPAGAFGYPTSDEQATLGGGGRVNYMSGTACGTSNASGLYFSSSTGTWPVHGCIFQKYKSIGEDRSGLGFPTSDEISVSGGVQQNFSNGNIRDIGGTITVNINGSSSCTSYGPYMTGPNACVGFYTTSTWFSSNGAGLHGQAIWTYANGTVKDSTANYSLTGLDTTHVWQLQAYIPNCCSDASHAHYHFCSPGGGCADGYVNQNNYTNQWATFGAVCTSDGTATIQLADDGGDVYPAVVGADAIRAVRLSYIC